MLARRFRPVSSVLFLVPALAACEPVDEGPPKTACMRDRDCQDGDLCDGLERCDDGVCLAGAAVLCEAGELCLAVGECGALTPATPACDAPRAPVVGRVPVGVALPFDRPVDLGTSVDPLAGTPVAWTSGDRLTFDTPGVVTVFARPTSGDRDCVFRATYEVVAALPASADDAASDAVAFDDARIVGWAAGWVEPVAWGSDNDPGAADARRALGPAGEDLADVASLGNGGALTMVLPFAVGDGPGPELAVFENGFTEQFLELAFVEVSSDGEHFARFDALAFDMDPVSAYGTLDPSRVTGVAGLYPVGLGVPFDLATLAWQPSVRAGLVDLGAITHVRVVDIIGDGGARDALGAPIYDPTPTWGSAGFDLDGVAVLAPAGASPR